MKDDRLLSILKIVRSCVFILCITGLSIYAMKVTGDVRWIWFSLFGLFAL